MKTDELYIKFAKLYKCDSITNCKGSSRHDRQNKYEQDRYFRRPTSSKSTELLNNKDTVYQQELDKIHSFFLHPYNEKRIREDWRLS